MFDVIAFDADDTLWHNERYYSTAKQKLQEILCHYHQYDWIDARLDVTERRNLRRYGYGIKSFALSMIETAIELSNGQVTGNEIHELITVAWEMLRQPMEILDGVEETIRGLAHSHRLMIITKGDLFEQEAKIARSGLADLFAHIEIVSEKTPQSYAAIIARYQLAPDRFLMVGNSLKSDVLPVLDIGGHAIHIPAETTWIHELVDEAELAGKYIPRLDNIRQVVEWLETINVAGRQ
ncbi:MAG: HAD family hydrolase [Blastocatellia bacterium]